MFAMYLRKSRKDLELEEIGQGETLARHRSMLLDLAAKHEIMPDQIVEYKEMVSGESIAARPEMQRLLNDVYLKKYQAVFVVEVERLARGNTKDQGEVADAFQYSGTKIITPAKIYDPHNEFDQEYFEFGLFMSRREYNTIKRRMEAGRIQSIQEGNYVGSVRPFGYNIQRIHKKERILVINEDEAPVVRMIFDWFTKERRSAGWIAKELTRLQIPTTTGNAEWNRGTVVDILKNTHYIGNVRWKRRATSKEYDPGSGQLSKRKRRLTPDQYLEYKGKHQAIIDPDQFYLAQSLFIASVPVQLQHEIVNPFAGLLCCAECGKALTYQSFQCNKGKTTPRYIHKDSVLCKKKSIAADVLTDAVIASLKAYIDDFEVKMSNDTAEEKIKNNAVLIDLMQKEIRSQEKKKERLFDSWESDDGTYTREEFIARKKMYTESIEDLKGKIIDLQKATPGIIDYKAKIATLHQTIDLLKDDNSSAKVKNDFLKTFVNRIEYDVIDLGRNKGGKPVLDLFLK